MIQQALFRQSPIYRHFLSESHSIFLFSQAINIPSQLFTTFTHTRSLKGNVVLLISQDTPPSFYLVAGFLIKFQQRIRRKLQI
jgi:hypothetical protein